MEGRFALLAAILLSGQPPSIDASFDAFDDTQSDWISLMARNTDFIIQAEEVLADNFALVMQWRATGVFPAVIPDGFQVNDPGLLVAIEDRVRRGCGHDR